MKTVKMKKGLQLHYPQCTTQMLAHLRQVGRISPSHKSARSAQVMLPEQLSQVFGMKGRSQVPPVGVALGVRGFPEAEQGPLFLLQVGGAEVILGWGGAY